MEIEQTGIKINSSTTPGSNKFAPSLMWVVVGGRVVAMVDIQIEGSTVIDVFHRSEGEGSCRCWLMRQAMIGLKPNP